MTTDTTAGVPDVGELERNWIAFAKDVDALLSEFVSVYKENEALRKRLEAADAARNYLRGVLWFAWSEANAIRARSGAPLTHEGITTCAESWWSDMTDMFEDAIGKDATTPWASPEAVAALAAYRETQP